MNEEFRIIDADLLSVSSVAVADSTGKTRRFVRLTGIDVATENAVSGVMHGAAATALAAWHRLGETPRVLLCPRQEVGNRETSFRFAFVKSHNPHQLETLVRTAAGKLGLPGAQWLTALANETRGMVPGYSLLREGMDMVSFIEAMSKMDIGMRGIPSMLADSLYLGWPSLSDALLYDTSSPLYRAFRPSLVKAHLRAAYQRGSTAALVEPETRTEVSSVRCHVLPFPMKQGDVAYLEDFGISVLPLPDEDGNTPEDIADVFVQEVSVTKTEQEWFDCITTPASPSRSLRACTDRSALFALAPSAAKLDREQQQAIFRALQHRVSVVTGGPGTGKTTTMAAVAEALDSEWQLRLLAPTGKAARRLSEATGLQASTIHRWALTEHDDRPLAIVVDEASMLDVDMLGMLLGANIARVVLVGDVDQLPSVGPGNVLKDTLELLSRTEQEDAVTRLQFNYRSGQQPALMRAVASVREGQYRSQILSTQAKDFARISVDADQRAMDAMSKMRDMWLSDVKAHGFENVQALIPIYKGGIYAFNTWAQEVLNPHSPVLIPGGAGRLVRDGDRVVFTENMPDYEIYNGAIGVLRSSQDAEVVQFTGDDGHVVDIPRSDLYVDGQPVVICGYAISVHRSQGSEWDRVHVLVLDHFGKALYRESLYTALTRAKERAILHATDSALIRVFSNRDNNDRLTLLADVAARPRPGAA